MDTTYPQMVSGKKSTHKRKQTNGVKQEPENLDKGGHMVFFTHKSLYQ